MEKQRKDDRQARQQQRAVRSAPPPATARRTYGVPGAAARRAVAALALAAGCTISSTSDAPARDSAGRATAAAETAAAGTTTGGTTAAGAPTAAPAAGAAPAVAPPAPADSAARVPADSAVDPTRVPPDRRPLADMRLQVDVKARRLYVYRGETRTATHPVGVGSSEWPTATGNWVVSQVVWNPEWVPPEESWAAGRERKAPGARDNPLGRVQLVYDPPRTIHGTNEPASVGKAVSHGSIRMRDETIARLARDVMEAAGVGEDAAWHRRVQENRTEKRVVDLPRVVPIEVR